MKRLPLQTWVFPLSQLGTVTSCPLYFLPLRRVWINFRCNPPLCDVKQQLDAFPPSLYKPSFLNFFFLVCHVLCPPVHPNGFLLDLLQYWERGKLDVVFQMWPHNSNHFPCPAGYALNNAAQSMVSLHRCEQALPVDEAGCCSGNLENTFTCS